MDSMTLKQQAIDTIQHYTDLGNRVFHTNMPCPKTDFSVKGTVGGKYTTARHTVMVNMILFAENVQDYLNQTIPHEVAHAFQRHLYGQYRYGKRVMPHGKEWKSIMIALGKDPKRCHSYDTSNATQRTVARAYPYKCNCRTYHLTAIRHKRMQTNQTTYSCKACHSRLQYSP